MRGILTYHSIDPTGSPISIDEAAFREHVRWLVSGAVRVVPLDRIDAPDTPDDALAITFDDAFRNFDEVAWPLLRAHRVPVTLFVVSGHAGGTNDWAGRRTAGVPSLPLMDWDALSRVAGEGVMLGAHSRTHPDLRGMAEPAIESEMAGSADDIAARTGTRPHTFAYPYGGVDACAAAVATRSFTHAVTTQLKLVEPSDRPERLPRLDAFYLRDPGKLEAWGTPAFRNGLRLRAALRRVRAAVTGGPA